MLVIFYPYFAEVFQLSVGEIVACFSMGSMLFLWGSPFWAKRSDQGSRVNFLKLGLAGNLLSLIFLLALHRFHDTLPSALVLSLLALSRVVYGVSASAIVPVSQAIIADGSKVKNRLRSFSSHSIALQLGRLLGPVLALFFLGWSASLAIVAFILVNSLLLSGRSSNVHATQKAQFTEKSKVLSPKGNNAQHLPALAIALLATSFVGILQSSLAALAQERLGLTAIEAADLMALILIASSVAMIITQLLMRRIISSPWQGSLPAGGVLLLLAGFIFTYTETLAAIWIAAFCTTTAIALLTPSYMAILSLSSTGKQGQIAGKLAAAHTLGYGLGGLISAATMSFGMQLPFFASMLIAALIILQLPFVYKIKSAISLEELAKEPSCN